MTTMQAAWYEKTGPAREVLRLGELPVPEPGIGQVRVQLHTSGINPSDTKTRAGWRGAALDFPRIIPHSDGAGVIESVGKGVGEDRVGDRVWVYNARYQRPFGTAAEYVVLPESQCVLLPDTASFAVGACLGIPAQTAHRAVFADGPVSGETILVAGGAGAVGHYAVQFAAIGGATVIATVSSAAKAEHAKAAGAAHMINRREEDIIARVMEITGGSGVDRVVEVDFGANVEIDVAITKPNSVIASYSSTAEPEPVLPYYALGPRGITLRLVGVYVLPAAAQAAAVAKINGLLSGDRLINTVAKRYPLAEIAAAHEALESGEIIGNIVLDIC